ncbi:MAG: hypothetical protein SPF56_09480 [Bacteroidaceae bacterium]|nr:hypothetical protein [Prevotellaceae bacterium]MDY5632698.1 hypothetical protein [Bacteroidaceae bacterium]
MKKTLLLIAAAFVAATSFAQDVTIDFANGVSMFGLPGASSGKSPNYVADGDFKEAKSATVEGVKITVSPAAEGKTANRIWATAPQLRMYSGTLTISAEQPFSKVVFNLGSNAAYAKWGANTVNTGTLSAFVSGQNNSVTWTGSTKELVLSVAANTQFSSIVVTLGEGGGDTPEPPAKKDPSNTAATAYTAAQAKAIIDAATEYDLTKTVFVKGTIAQVVDIEVTKFKNATFDIEDGFRIFRTKDFNGTDITDANRFKAGDIVVVKGNLVLYTKDGVSTYELTKGQLVELNGAVATGVELLKADSAKAQAYDLSGRVVNTNAKGVVIVNGKKVVK